MPEPTRFRSRPDEIEAIQWDRTEAALDAISEFTQHVIERRDNGTPYKVAEQFMLILPGWDDLARDVLGDEDVERRLPAGYDAVVYDRLHGTWVNVRQGDWIIRGTEGEFYPCADEVLRKKYEQVTDA